MNVAFLGIFWTYTKNLSYLTDNFPKQGYKILFFPYPAALLSWVLAVWVWTPNIDI